MLPVFASVPKTMVARAPPVPVPVAWAVSPVAGTVWHSLQARAVARQRVPERWAAWAPTAAKVAAELPAVSTAPAV